MIKPKTAQEIDALQVVLVQSHPSTFMHDSSKTFACKLTGNAPSAICVIELDGPDASGWLNRYWIPATGKPNLEINAIRYGQFKFLNSIGESIVVCRTNPHRFELHCHGGKIAAQSILTAIETDGILIRSEEEWCYQHSNDPIIAEATLALTQAKTLRTTRILLDQQRGSLSLALANIELALEENDLPRARSLYLALASWNHVGKHLINPFDILLCGPPNVGKSSLLNQILGYQRAIVHHQAGTTRDLLAEESSIDGWPVKIIDSAGIRDSSDRIEQIGVERTIQRSKTADLQLILVDPQIGWSIEHQQLFDSKPTQSLIAITKYDLDSTPIAEILKDKQHLSIAHQVSSVTGFGIPELLTAIARKLVPVDPPNGQAILFSETLREKLLARFG